MSTEPRGCRRTGISLRRSFRDGPLGPGPEPKNTDHARTGTIAGSLLSDDGVHGFRARGPSAAPRNDQRRGFVGLMVVILVALMLAGCGKKNAPTAPPDEPNTYPRPYPSE